MSIDTINQADLTLGSAAQSIPENGSQTSDGGQFQGILSELQDAVEFLQQVAGSEGMFAQASQQIELSDSIGSELPQAESAFRFSELSGGLPVEDIETSAQLDSEDGELGFLGEDTAAITLSALDTDLDPDQAQEGKLFLEEPSMLESQILNPLEIGIPPADAQALAGAAIQSMDKSLRPSSPVADTNDPGTAEFGTDEQMQAETELELSTADNFRNSANGDQENVTHRVVAGVESADTDSSDFVDTLSNVPGHSNQHSVTPLTSRTDTGASIEPLNKPVGHQAWRQDVGERLIWMTDRSVQSAEIRLNPAHLGPMQVRIDMDQDQTNVIFASQHSAVREALESAIPKLREMFGDLDLNLGEVQIAKQTFNQQQEGNENGPESEDQSQASRFSLDSDQENNEDEVTQKTLSGAGILNLYV